MNREASTNQHVVHVVDVGVVVASDDQFRDPPFPRIVAVHVDVEAARPDLLDDPLQFVLCLDAFWRRQFGAVDPSETERAGELVADLRRGGEDYLDFYCSGIGADKHSGYMPEGSVSERVLKTLADMGWSPVRWEEERDVI